MKSVISSRVFLLTICFFGIAKLPRSLKEPGILLRPYRLKELVALYALFVLEFFPSGFVNEGKPFNSFFSFWIWIRATFQMSYVIESVENNGRRIVGFVGYYGIKLDRSLFLSLIIFNPKDRRQGYGEKAMEMIMRSIKRYDIVETVYVTILRTNRPSLRFFLQLGFEICREDADKVLLQRSRLNRGLETLRRGGPGIRHPGDPPRHRAAEGQGRRRQRDGRVEI